MVIDAERPARESVAVWAARLGYYLWGEPAQERGSDSHVSGTVRVGPFTGDLNPIMRSWAR